MTFEEKYDDTMKKVDRILKTDSDHNTLKKYIEGYKIEKMMQVREEKKIEESFQLYGLVDKSMLRQRKQIVGLAEIREHEKTYNKAKYEKIALKEINRMQEREKYSEFKMKLENEMKMNKERFENFEQMKDEQKTKANIIFSNNFKKKEFSNFVNKINIERIQNSKIPSPQYSQEVSKRIPKHQQQQISLPQQQKQYEQLNQNEYIRNKVSYSQQQKKRIFQLNKQTNDMNNSKERRNVFTLPQQTKSKPKSIKKSIENKKNYLQEGLKYAKINRDNKFNVLSESKKYDNKADFVNNLESLKFQARKYEDLAQRQEQLIKLNGGAKNNLKATEKASNYIFDSIIAKISLLKQMSVES